MLLAVDHAKALTTYETPVATHPPFQRSARRSEVVRSRAGESLLYVNAKDSSRQGSLIPLLLVTLQIEIVISLPEATRIHKWLML